MDHFVSWWFRGTDRGLQGGEEGAEEEEMRGQRRREEGGKMDERAEKEGGR